MRTHKRICPILLAILLNTLLLSRAHSASVGVCDDGEYGIREDLEDFKCHGEKFVIQDYNFPAGVEQCVEHTDEAEHVCMSSPIAYNATPPSSGAHRQLWPQYGEYDYAPPQRWVHSLEHGAVVFLYHPCAPDDQIVALKRLARSCLWRHVITTYPHLTADQPLAMVTWGCVYRMSWVDVSSAEQWIKKHALTAPEGGVSQDGTYNYGLQQAAVMVSTADDAQLCPKSDIKVTVTPSNEIAVATTTQTSTPESSTEPATTADTSSDETKPTESDNAETTGSPKIHDTIPPSTDSDASPPVVDTTDSESDNSTDVLILYHTVRHYSIAGMVFVTGLLAVLLVIVLLFALWKCQPSRRRYGRYKDMLPFSLPSENGIAIPSIGIPKGNKAEAEVLLPDDDDEDEI